MAEARIERRLAAILAADVVGYSQLMSIDEVRTLNALKAHRRELLDPAIAAHHGRIVKTTGDGALVEFASVVDAVGCAVVVQRGMVSRNARVAEDRRIVFRIGINVGDIIIDGDDIFGDGVNIAARLEALCEPGGLCISRAANDQIRDKLSLAFADLGEQAVKNISRAVGVFGLAAKEIEALPEPEVAPPKADLANAATRQPEPRYEQEILLLHDGGRRAACLFAHRQRTAAGQNRQLDDPSRIRFREPGLAAPLSRAVARPYADPLRRARQRPVGS